MSFELQFTELAADQLRRARTLGPEGRRKKILKTLGLLETNPRHPGLQTHKYSGLRGLNGEEVFEAYVENRTPSAWRVFWHYGPPEPGQITIIVITPASVVRRGALQPTGTSSRDAATGYARSTPHPRHPDRQDRHERSPRKGNS